jgi:hypothetical protein
MLPSIAPAAQDLDAERRLAAHLASSLETRLPSRWGRTRPCKRSIAPGAPRNNTGRCNRDSAARRLRGSAKWWVLLSALRPKKSREKSPERCGRRHAMSGAP